MKKEAKKAITVAKNNAYERLYQRLESKEEKEAFELARAREITTRDLGSVRCTKLKDSKVLIEDTKVQERSQSYFFKLFNWVRFHSSQHSDQRGREKRQNYIPCCLTSKGEIKEALRKMKAERAVGPHSIPVEIWKCLGEEGHWLMESF